MGFSRCIDTILNLSVIKDADKCKMMTCCFQIFYRAVSFPRLLDNNSDDDDDDDDDDGDDDDNNKIIIIKRRRRKEERGAEP